ncbi:hypothetical protein [Mesorhizobium sp. B2-6-5]|uniref:hypothetical protein n=1 Tax=Mesorhizobium sp. B2-6-5 TaxID=2589912 RepID=UPI0011708CFD|nr:hypothetical protein [Mesorhizobium sp. B2-6-5]TPJ38668.1 hypothetical protein FJ432_21440 [Mesorhizobium sp. B2-6-5]
MVNTVNALADDQRHALEVFCLGSPKHRRGNGDKHGDKQRQPRTPEKTQFRGFDRGHLSFRPDDPSPL